MTASGPIVVRTAEWASHRKRTFKPMFAQNIQLSPSVVSVWRRSPFEKGGKGDVAAHRSDAFQNLNFHQEVLQRFSVGSSHFHENTAVAGDGVKFLDFGPVGEG